MGTVRMSLCPPTAIPMNGSKWNPGIPIKELTHVSICEQRRSCQSCVRYRVGNTNDEPQSQRTYLWTRTAVTT